jgi:hypothetical protein
MAFFRFESFISAQVLFFNNKLLLLLISYLFPKQAIFFM